MTPTVSHCWGYSPGICDGSLWEVDHVGLGHVRSPSSSLYRAPAQQSHVPHSSFAWLLRDISSHHLFPVPCHFLPSELAVRCLAAPRTPFPTQILELDDREVILLSTWVKTGFW